MYVYGAYLFFMSVVVILWGLWECLLCSGRCEDSVFCHGVLKYVVCLCKGGGCCVFVCIVSRGAAGARVWEV